MRLSFREDKEEKEEEDKESKKSSNSPSRKVEIVEVKEEVRNYVVCYLSEKGCFKLSSPQCRSATEYARTLITEGKSTVLLIAWGWGVAIIGPD